MPQSNKTDKKIPYAPFDLHNIYIICAILLKFALEVHIFLPKQKVVTYQLC